MYDLYIKNGKTINEVPIEIAVHHGEIVEVSEKLSVEAQDTIDLENNSYISAGWIDDHTHCFEKMDLYYDFPDTIGVQKGVTTVIDAGTTGAKNIGEFHELAKDAETNVYALLNISESGIVHQDELADMDKINEELIQTALTNYPEFIVGLKARMSKTVIGDNGIKPLELAKRIQANTKNLPLMVHIGSNPPTLDEVLSRLDIGDIVTHVYNGKPNGILNSEGNVKEIVWEAYNKGIIFDVGHGSDSFNFGVAEKAKEEGLVCQTLSTDIYQRNRENGPVFDFATTMEKMLVLGYSLEDILPMVTAHPAEVFQLTKKGKLAVGFDADITIFNIEEGNKELIDSNGNKRVTNTLVRPIYTIINGQKYTIEGE